MNEELNSSEKPPQSSTSPKPKSKRYYSSHPRVQRAFRSLVNFEKAKQQQTRTPSGPDKSLVSNPLTLEEIEALRQNKKAAIEYFKEHFKTVNREKAGVREEED